MKKFLIILSIALAAITLFPMTADAACEICYFRWFIGTQCEPDDCGNDGCVDGDLCHEAGDDCGSPTQCEEIKSLVFEGDPTMTERPASERPDRSPPKLTDRISLAKGPHDTAAITCGQIVF